MKLLLKRGTPVGHQNFSLPVVCFLVWFVSPSDFCSPPQDWFIFLASWIRNSAAGTSSRFTLTSMVTSSTSMTITLNREEDKNIWRWWRDLLSLESLHPFLVLSLNSTTTRDWSWFVKQEEDPILLFHGWLWEKELIVITTVDSILLLLICLQWQRCLDWGIWGEMPPS